MDELDEKCITASVLDNSNNLDNMEFDKKTDDDKFYDKIQLKQSDYSGDEWRTSCQFQLFWKGICVFDAVNNTIEDALVQIMNILRNPSSYKIKNLTTHKCFQYGCSNDATVKYQLKEEFSSQGQKLDKKESIFRHVRYFCDEHSCRGDCGLEDATRNYIKLDDSLKITDLSSDKCITASVLDNSDNLDNMEFDKKTDDDKFYDKIQLKIVPRYKQSDYSGDEWRTSCQFQLFLKGICVFDAINHTIEDALVQIMNILRNPSSYKIKNTKLDDSLKITDLSSDKCTEKLIKDLIAALACQHDQNREKINAILKKARENCYHDFLSYIAFPIMTLVKDLNDANLHELAEWAEDGKYDA